ncbi:flagellar basal body-associated FliL family protein [Parachitinimonas caeni]|uniref:Flagellar protein FliL n=1 Tax=Parachitinimonas caeni TaxID=3031301 RepID=A0ABT7DVD5_9NEIS|nr:flagellar basal body-associated FliL family protein [Parachitinimonas caeni]MDK2123789.1 flagellar basal body-associated FliL family protein [Parachitinimonas caeni]
MAEAKKAAPAPAAAAEAAPAGKSKKNLVLYIVIALLTLVILVGGGVGAVLFLTMGTNTAAEDPAAAHDEESGGKEHKKEKKSKKKGGDHAPIFEKLDTFTVNLSGGSTVLQTEIHVELDDEKMKETIKGYTPKLRSEIILLMSSKKPEDVSTTEGKVKLQAELKEKINKVLGAGEDDDGVKSVQFNSFIVQ